MLKTVTKPVPAMLRDASSGREVFFTAAESTFNSVEDEIRYIPSPGPCARAPTSKTRPRINNYRGRGCSLGLYSVHTCAQYGIRLSK